jgi:hypothetical protein
MTTEPAPEDFYPTTHRMLVVRHALLYTIALVPLVVGAIIAAVNVYIPLFIICLLFGIPCAYMAYSHLRDLGVTGVMMTEGEVTKKWTKANLLFFLMRGYYIAVGGKIYSVKPEDYAGLLETDLVHIYHFPHSLAVDRIERYDEIDKKFIPAGDDGAGEVRRRY